MELEKLRRRIEELLEPENEFLELIRKFAESRQSLREVNDARVEELSLELATLKEEINEKDRSEQDLYDACSNLEIEANRLEREAAEIGGDAANARNKWDDLNRRKIQASMKFAKRDVEYMTSIEKKLKAYKRLTGVYWDYNNSCRTLLKGFVCNKNSTSSRKLLMFEYDLDDSAYGASDSVPEIAAKIWNKIELSCSSPTPRTPLVQIQ